MNERINQAVKMFARQFILATAIALAVSGIARAKDDDEDGKRCSISTLRGLYVFTASGFNIVAGVPQPKAIVELIRFDGRGAATVPAVTVSINGVIINGVPESVEYTLDSDCTG